MDALLDAAGTVLLLALAWQLHQLARELSARARTEGQP